MLARADTIVAAARLTKTCGRVYTRSPVLSVLRLEKSLGDRVGCVVIITYSDILCKTIDWVGRPRHTAALAGQGELR